MFALALTMMPLSALADSRQVTAERVRRPPTQWGTVYECTKTTKMSCKQDCPTFWEHTGSSDFGCCSSWSSCGGYRKTCTLTYRDFYCDRRRSEAEIEEADLDEFMSTLEMVDGQWVKLSSPRADDGVADRLHEAGLFESDGTFEVEQVPPEAEFMSTSDDADTKHFVMEDGEWVELSQEQAKEVTTNDSEEGDVDLSEDIEGARRRFRWPGSFPGRPKLCKDEMTMGCNLPCFGGWSLVDTIENDCCMRGPGSPWDRHCNGHQKVCKKVYFCW